MGTKTFKPVRLRHTYAFLLLILTGTGACSDMKKLVYFNDIKDASVKSSYANLEPVIQINDILSIVVTSLDPTASAVFNAPNESSYNSSSISSATNRLTIGYLVNQKGDIQFPFLGTIHVAGQTKSQVTKYITDQILEKKLLLEPITTIRHLNYRVSVLGEVAKPGVYSVPNEKLSLLEALSFAGDITIYGKRTDVLLIREDDKGEKTIRRLDLTQQEILTSPYYYLQSNDIIYVEPNKDRLARERTSQITPIVLSIISLAIVAITSFR